MSGDEEGKAYAAVINLVAEKGPKHVLDKIAERTVYLHTLAHVRTYLATQSMGSGASESLFKIDAVLAGKNPDHDPRDKALRMALDFLETERDMRGDVEKTGYEGHKTAPVIKAIKAALEGSLPQEHPDYSAMVTALHRANEALNGRETTSQAIETMSLIEKELLNLGIACVKNPFELTLPTARENLKRVQDHLSNMALEKRALGDALTSIANWQKNYMTLQNIEEVANEALFAAGISKE